MKIHIIGGGQMARALLFGLQEQQCSMHNIRVSELDTAKHALLVRDFAIHTENSFSAYTDLIILAVKPQQMRVVCLDLLGKMGSALLVSIAAGIGTASIASWTQHPFIVRAMPNTPVKIQAGVTALFANAAVSELQRASAESLFSSLGKTLWLDDESLMDVVTAISGSGPAFVFYFMEAMIESATALGLPLVDAILLVQETFFGAALLAKQSANNIEQLREEVTSPGGTTAVGLSVLEQAQVKAILIKVGKATVLRARELGKI